MGYFPGYGMGGYGGYGGYGGCGCPVVSPFASTSAFVLVLFILLVIILKAFC